MRRLAALFSLLTLLGIFGAAALFLRLPPPPVDLPALTGQVDLIRVEKSARKMTLYQNGTPVRTYRIALGFTPAGDKLRQGDGKTPEGRFLIDRRNDRSAYHLSLGLNYPLPKDVARATKANYDPGGDIMIHGQPNALPGSTILKGDWTAGCIAVSNAEMQEIWAVTQIGTVVEVLP